MPPPAAPSWFAGAVILAVLVAFHVLAFRIGRRRTGRGHVTGAADPHSRQARAFEDPRRPDGPVV